MSSASSRLDFWGSSTDVHDSIMNESWTDHSNGQNNNFGDETNSNNILLGGPINLFGTIQFTCNSKYVYTHTYIYIPINNLILWNIAIFLNNWILK